MSLIDHSFIGAGGVHIQPYDKGSPLLPMGNISEFAFSFDEEKKEQKNFLGGGGLRNVVSRISGITGSIKAHDFTPENIALALRASLSSVGATPVLRERFSVPMVRPKNFCRFMHIPDLTQPITLKDSADQTLVTRCGLQPHQNRGARRKWWQYFPRVVNRRLHTRYRQYRSGAGELWQRVLTLYGRVERCSGRTALHHSRTPGEILAGAEPWVYLGRLCRDRTGNGYSGRPVGDRLRVEPVYAAGSC